MVIQGTLTSNDWARQFWWEDERGSGEEIEQATADHRGAFGHYFDIWFLKKRGGKETKKNNYKNNHNYSITEFKKQKRIKKKNVNHSQEKSIPINVKNPRKPKTSTPKRKTLERVPQASRQKLAKHQRCFENGSKISSEANPQ